MSENAAVHETKGYINTADGKLYYESKGTGLTVILLHGNGEDMSAMKSCAKVLTGMKFRSLLIDSRAHGRSVLKKEAFKKKNTSVEMAEDVRAVMKGLDIEKAIILGFSDGANTALEFAAAYPCMTEAVIAISPNAEPGGLIWPVLFAAGLKLKLTEMELKNVRAGSQAEAELKKKKLRLGLLTDSPHFSEEKLESIRCPVLILSGSSDIIKRKHTEWIGKHIEKARVVIIKGSSHLGFLYKRHKYMPYITSFISRIRADFCARRNIAFL